MLRVSTDRAPDNSTVIGAAEVAGLITTKDMSTFFSSKR